MQERGLLGRGAVVLAASQGLGRAVAEGLARQGAHLALCSRDAGAIQRVGDEIAGRHGVPVWAAVVDVTRGADLEAFVSEAGQRLGGLHTLVTNSGGPKAGAATAMSDAEWEAGFNLTLMSVVRAVRAALPWMEGRPGANIVSIVSSSAKVPIEDLVLSNAFRPAIVGLAKTLSLELAPRGIRVNSVAPGRIDTERVRHLDGVHGQRHGVSAEDWRQRSEASIPLGRYGTVEEFADAVVFLASDAARYVTGQCLFVDGGLTRTLL